MNVVCYGGLSHHLEGSLQELSRDREYAGISTEAQLYEYLLAKFTLFCNVMNDEEMLP